MTPGSYDKEMPESEAALHDYIRKLKGEIRASHIRLRDANRAVERAAVDARALAVEVWRWREENRKLRQQLNQVQQEAKPLIEAANAIDAIRTQRDELVEALADLINYYHGEEATTTHGWMAKYDEAYDLLTRIKATP